MIVTDSPRSERAGAFSGLFYWFAGFLQQGLAVMHLSVDMLGRADGVSGTQD